MSWSDSNNSAKVVVIMHGRSCGKSLVEQIRRLQDEMEGEISALIINEEQLDTQELEQAYAKMGWEIFDDIPNPLPPIPFESVDLYLPEFKDVDHRTRHPKYQTHPSNPRKRR